MKERLPRHVETSVFPSGNFGRFSHRLPCLFLSMSLLPVFLLVAWNRRPSYGIILLSLRNIMNLRFDGSTLDKKSLSSHRREFDILILVEMES